MSDEAVLARDNEVGFPGGLVIFDSVIDVHNLDEFGGVFFEYTAIFQYLVGFNHLQDNRMTDVAFQQRLERCARCIHQFFFHLGYIFVLRSEDGVVRAAFNACDVCYAAKRGYTQDGDVMVCMNCGRRFPADQINVLQGGCNPAPLERAIDLEDLVLRVDDIVRGSRYF